MNDITLTGWALSYRAKEEETGMFPASLCIDLPDCAIFVFLRFFHALAPQEEALATEPEMKKKAWFLPTCALIFLIVPSLLPQGDDGTMQIEEECGGLNLELYSTVFMVFVQNGNGWCDCFSRTGCAGWSFDHWAKDEEAGMFPASLCIDFWVVLSIIVQGKDSRLQSGQERGTGSWIVKYFEQHSNTSVSETSCIGSAGYTFDCAVREEWTGIASADLCYLSMLLLLKIVFMYEHDRMGLQRWRQRGMTRYGL